MLWAFLLVPGCTEGTRWFQTLQTQRKNRYNCINANTNKPLDFFLPNKDANSWEMCTHTVQALTTCCQPQVELVTVACWQPPARQLEVYQQTGLIDSLLPRAIKDLIGEKIGPIERGTSRGDRP